MGQGTAAEVSGPARPDAFTPRVALHSGVQNSLQAAREAGAFPLIPGTNSHPLVGRRPALET